MIAIKWSKGVERKQIHQWGSVHRQFLDMESKREGRLGGV